MLRIRSIRRSWAVALTMLSCVGLHAQVREETETGPIVVEVRDLAGDIWRWCPPVFAGEARVNSLDSLREWLMRERGLLGGSRPTGRISARRLVLRSDPGAEFGWTQAVLHAATFTPGRPKVLERFRPLISDVTLELRGSRRGTRLQLPVRNFRLGSTVVLLSIEGSTTESVPSERTISIHRGEERTEASLLGRIDGVDLGASPDPPHRLKLASPEVLSEALKYLIAERRAPRRGRRPGAVLAADPGVPFAAAVEILRIMEEAGFENRLIRGLTSGSFRAIDRKGVVPAKNVPPYSVSIIGRPTPATDATPSDAGAREGPLRPQAPAGGGAPATQRCVERGLDWLARHQEPDGSWKGDGFGARCEEGSRCDGAVGSDHDVGLTGLSVLAFLGAGHTHREGTHKNTVRKGLRWLRAEQNAQGRFGGGGGRSAYDHAIGALAMAVGYGRTRSGIWKGSAQNGIDCIHRWQNPGRGWRYQPADGESDTSVTAWMILALETGAMAGLDVDHGALVGPLNFLREVTDTATGRAGYRRSGEGLKRPEGLALCFPSAASEALTAAAIVGRIMAGEDSATTPAISQGAALLLQCPPVWDPEAGTIDMYYWHFATLAASQLGGETWKSWWEKLVEVLVSHQVEEGCAAGSWDPIGPWGSVGGRIYATALMTRTLER